MTTGHVIKGPTSSGQGVCTGIWDRSSGADCSCARARRTTFGWLCKAARSIGQRDRASRMPSTGAGLRRAARNWPKAGTSSRCRPRPAATRDGVPKRLAMIGICACRPALWAASNRSTGPPARKAASWTAVISWRMSTGAVTRVRSPAVWAWDRNARRSGKTGRLRIAGGVLFQGP